MLKKMDIKLQTAKKQYLFSHELATEMCLGSRLLSLSNLLHLVGESLVASMLLQMALFCPFYG